MVRCSLVLMALLILEGCTPAGFIRSENDSAGFSWEFDEAKAHREENGSISVSARGQRRNGLFWSRPHGVELSFKLSASASTGRPVSEREVSEFVLQTWGHVFFARSLLQTGTFRLSQTGPSRAHIEVEAVVASDAHSRDKSDAPERIRIELDADLSSSKRTPGPR